MGIDYTFTTDSNEIIERTFEDQDGEVVDLTGAMYVRIHMIQRDLVVSRDMTVTDATAGLAEYQLQTGDLKSGKVSFEFELKDSAGKKFRNDELDGPFSVRRASA